MLCYFCVYQSINTVRVATPFLGENKVAGYWLLNSLLISTLFFNRGIDSVSSRACIIVKCFNANLAQDQLPG